MRSRHDVTRLACAVAWAALTAFWLCSGARATEEGQAPASAEKASADTTAKKAKTYRWGVGWDEGLALRVRMGQGWGLGLRVNPDLVDPDSETDSLTDSADEYPCGTYGRDVTCRDTSGWHSDGTTTGNRRTISTALMLYHERNLGKWLGGGPYLALGYERLSQTETVRTDSQNTWSSEHPWAPSEKNESDRTTETTTRTWERSLIIELGLRPVFRFHERLALETRFGLELRLTDWDATRRSRSGWTGGGSDVVYPPGTPVPRTTANGTGSDSSEEHRSGSENRFHAVGERLGPGAQLRFVVYF